MKNKRIFKKVISLTLALLMAGATAITGLPAGASAAGNNVLLTNQTVSGDATYIGTYLKTSNELAGCTEFEVTFKYNSLGTLATDNEVGFNDTLEFLVFDSGWGGWNRTTVGPNGYDKTEAVTPALNTEYTVKVPFSVIEAKLSTSGSPYGFNLQTGGIGNTSVTIVSLKAVEGNVASEPAVIEGSWRKTSSGNGDSGSMSVKSGTVVVSTNDWNIQVGNMNLKDFTSPVVAVTVEYTGITETIYPQSEVLDSSYEKIEENYPKVDRNGEVIYFTSIPNTMTSMILAYDTCEVKKIEIFDDSETLDCTHNIADLTNANIVAKMGAGWNLGNALDSTTNGETGETLWGNPKIAKRLFEKVKKAGFDTVRIPVTYLSAVTVNGNNVTVDQTKLSTILDRVDKVVKMAADYDLFVVTNIMHDGGEGVTGKWIKVDGTTTYTRNMNVAFKTIWTEIANRLKKYDQHVIFESMNEIMESGNYNDAPWNSSTWDIINDLNQSFVDAVRATGGNNATRFLLIPGYNTNINQTVTDNFVMPADTASNKLMVSVHFYDPYNFTLNTGSGSTTTTTKNERDAIGTQFAKLKTKFIDKGIPVVIGEFSAADKNNYDDIAIYIAEVVKQAKEKGLAYIYWDNGDIGLYGSALWNRANLQTTQLGNELILILTGTQP